MLVYFDVRGQQRMDFFTGGMDYGLWIMDSHFGQKWWLKVKMPEWWICFLQAYSFSLQITDWLESCWLLVDYLMFLSAVWTLILTAPIYKLIYILDGLRVRNVLQIFIFGWTIPLICLLDRQHTITFGTEKHSHTSIYCINELFSQSIKWGTKGIGIVIEHQS